MKLAEQLRERKIFNEWMLLEKFGQPGKDVWIQYYPRESRWCMPAKTAIMSPSHKTDPTAPWYDNGCITFSGLRNESIPLAQKNAASLYGIAEWVPSPFGGASAKVPKYVLDAAKAWLKQEAAK